MEELDIILLAISSKLILFIFYSLPLRLLPSYITSKELTLFSAANFKFENSFS